MVLIHKSCINETLYFHVSDRLNTLKYCISVEQRVRPFNFSSTLIAMIGSQQGRKNFHLSIYIKLCLI